MIKYSRPLFNALLERHHFEYLCVNAALCVRSFSQGVGRYCDDDVEKRKDIRCLLPELVGFEEVFESLHSSDEKPFNLECIVKGERYIDLSIHAMSGEFLILIEDATDAYTLKQKLLQSRNETTLLSKRLAALNAELEVRVRKEVEKNRQNDYLLIQKSRQAAMGEMVAGIVHQWAQPLNLLSLNLFAFFTTLKSSEIDQSKITEFYDRNSGLIEGMGKTLQDFSTFFKPQAKKELFSISGALETMLSLFGESYSSQGIEIVSEIECPGMVMGYENQFIQMLLILLNNAKEAMGQNDSALKCIVIHLECMLSEVQLRIHDSGGGIPPERLGTIFDPYVTSKAEGSGLGLYLAKMIIQRHHKGNITVTNEGDGACFTITLPQKKSG